jgi:hypothetical protein
MHSGDAVTARSHIVVFAALLTLAAAPRAHAAWAPNGDSLCTAANAQSNLVAVSDGEGGEIVAWVDYRNSGSNGTDIYCQRISGLGQLLWSLDGVAVCTASGNQLNVAICTDGAHGAILVWEDNRFALNDADIYAVRLDSTGTVRPKWTANGTAVCNATGFQGLPTIASDGSSGAIIAWQDLRSDTLNQIFAQHLLNDGTVATGWGANGNAVAPVNGDQFNPMALPDGAHGAFIAWADARDLLGTNDALYMQRVTSSGTVATGWPAAGDSVCRAADGPQNFTMINDGIGGVLLSWQDYRNSSTGADIYAQRVRMNGTMAWTQNGMPVCTASGDQMTPSLVADGLGGGVIAWDDHRAGDLNATPYGQRLDSLAAMKWSPSTGVLLCNASGRRGEPHLVPDNAGGAIAAWQDYRSGANPDIYAQRVSITGTLPWGVAGGTAVCALAGDQQSPQPVSDLAGGAIIAWQDNRSNPGSSSAYDIYAQRILQNGQVAPTTDVPMLVAGAFVLMAPRPNPSRGPATIAFVLPEATRVEASVYDVTGREVATLASGAEFGAGRHELTWDGRDASGATAHAGLFFVRVHAGALTGTEKIVRVQ